LVGCQESSLLGGEEEYNELSGHYLKDFMDCDGFYVVDTGGWLSGEGAQLIECEMLYNFFTNGFSNPTKYHIYNDNFRGYVQTNSEIRTNDSMRFMLCLPFRAFTPSYNKRSERENGCVFLFYYTAER
ncbi:MAG: hypothetical protein II536_02975, partial [Clostridia bacterium]|nr:hypothetical protein [Clostridia bacterium]